ncbi:MAG TPA: ABC transporter ATP-binding protein [Gemmataceae bacterium]|nr:ABC transporter ATP-binding protein [Gemmataceae bacterium]
MATPLLEVSGLAKTFGTIRALAGVTLEVQQGEIFGLLGPNGAGKTTLLSIISGLLPADGGSFALLGQPLRRDRKHLLGIMPQELAIYGELTARENLRFFGKLYGLDRLNLERRIDEILGAVGLSDRADQRAETFSGGMKRRLNLGAALVHGPRLLLLDEPTAGVDPQSRHHIFEEVRRLNARGMTIVYTSHYMEEVQALCSRIGILDQGALVACDALTNLLRLLPGMIRLRIQGDTAPLRQRFSQFPDVRLLAGSGPVMELECADVTKVLQHVVAALNDQHVELAGLETEEPNLERVFLHLTGKTLRD